MQSKLIVALLSALATAPFSVSTAQEITPPEIVVRLKECRSIADQRKKIDCYDSYSQKLADLLSNKELVILSKADVMKTKRSLFGFPVQDAGIFRGNDKADTRIESKIISARRVAYGQYDMTIEGGAVWRNTDAITEAPDEGSKIVIKAGAMGSFFLTPLNQRPFRATRVR